MWLSRSLRGFGASVRRHDYRSLSTWWEGNICHSSFTLEPAPPYDIRFSEMVGANFDSKASKVAVVDGSTGEERTFGDLKCHTESIAFSLAEMGVGSGDVVGLFTPNSVDFYAAFHGAARLGATVTLLNPLYTSYEVESQLSGSRAKALITHPDCFDVASDAMTKLPGCKHLIQIGDTAPAGAVSLGSMIATRHAQNLPPTPVGGDDLACLPYSSGTTGLPKGTMLSHNNLIANLYQSEQCDGRFWGEDDVLISPLPFFHIYAFLFSVHLAALKGVKLVTMKRFDLELYLRLVQEHRCTRTHLVPPVILGLAKSPLVDQYDLSSLQCIISAAAPLGAEIELQASERLPGCIVKQAWGMSELSPLGTCVPDDALKPGTGSVGPPCPGTSVKIIDPESGKAKSCGEEGELCVQGPQVMRGYLDQPEKTRECLDDEGWLRTGDIAKLDKDGYVYITDRLKELIKYKGFQVAPAELEAVVCGHPLVADATVIPVEPVPIHSRKDEVAGEIPRAYVVLKPAAEISAEALVAWTAERVAPHKKLRGGVVFTEAIPKTASGKILRRLVIEQDRQQLN